MAKKNWPCLAKKNWPGIAKKNWPDMANYVQTLGLGKSTSSLGLAPVSKNKDGGFCRKILLQSISTFSSLFSMFSQYFAHHHFSY